MADVRYSWMFVRNDDALTIERLTPVCLAVSSSTGERRLHDFNSEVTLLEFQCELQKHLVATGWALDQFSPERRLRHADRRRSRAESPDRLGRRQPTP